MLLMLCSCHKKKVVYNGLPDDLKAYFGWQKGSYWIFKDTLRGTRDSFVVTSNLVGTGKKTFDRYSDDYEYETLEMRIEEYYTNNTDSSRIWLFELNAFKGLYESYLGSKSFSTEGGFTYGWPFVPGTDTGGYVDVGKTVITRSLIVSTTINNKDYDNVYRYEVVNPSHNYDDDVMINKDSGLVRIVLNNAFGRQVLLPEESHILR
ncbi:MAG: hypothetical protein JSS82_00990 [Bacteroidetes bacterium]|nr:hypothetical protein [Bacteroidota bacterium]